MVYYVHHSLNHKGWLSGRKNSWQVLSKPIQLKTAIGAGTKMPVHFIVSDGFQAMTWQQGSQCIKFFAWRIHHRLHLRNKNAVYIARLRAGVWQINDKQRQRNRQAKKPRHRLARAKKPAVETAGIFTLTHRLLLFVDPFVRIQGVIHQFFWLEDKVDLLDGRLRFTGSMNDVEAILQHIIATNCAWDGFNCICGTYFSVQFPERLKALFIDSYRFIGIHVLSCGEKINRFARTCNKRIF